jgi:AP-4 complex subunit sigma-1
MQNELASLELIHALVEALDRHFGSVCELDIMFNLDTAHWALDEFVSGGCVADANKTNALAALALLDKVPS